MQLLTTNLLLRTVEGSDLIEVMRMWNFGGEPISREEAQAAVEKMKRRHLQNKPGSIHHLCLAVFEKNSNRIIGWCGLDGETMGKLHIFFLIDEAYRNRGYATQCASKLLDYAFTEAMVDGVDGGCEQDNQASLKVMQKVGFVITGYEDNGDPRLYITAEQYRSLTMRKRLCCL